MISHHTRFRQNDDLPLWQGPAATEKAAIFTVRALITRGIMRSRQAMQYWGMTLSP